MDGVAERGKRGRVLDVAEGRLHSDSNETGDDERGELNLGIDRVGLGSDFDGCAIPSAMGDVTGQPKLLAALAARGYDAASIRKIAHENWIRVLGKTWRSG